jgi:hypothetical protein
VLAAVAVALILAAPMADWAVEATAALYFLHRLAGKVAQPILAVALAVEEMMLRPTAAVALSLFAIKSNALLHPTTASSIIAIPHTAIKRIHAHRARQLHR